MRRQAGRTDEGRIRNPRRIAAMLAPGFADD
jgi:hypothetical protein